MPSGPEAHLTRRAALALLGGAVATTACEQLSFVAANLPASLGAYVRHPDISYGDAPQQRLDVYVPTRPAQASRPLVVFWHGGRWTFGDKNEYRFVAEALCEIDCVAVLPNYRHYPLVRLAGFMDDAARAARWGAAHAMAFGADPNRVYLMGHSAGAHMAALLTLDGRYFAAQGGAPALAGLIGLSGPYDFLPLVEDDVKDMFGPPERYPESQPINFVHAGAPPSLLIHGISDVTVWPKNSRNLATALEARGVRVRLELYPHVRHAGTVAPLAKLARHRAPTLAQIAEFVGTRA